MPRDLSGLRLGMTPSEVSRAIPGIKIFRINAHRQEGDLDSHAVSVVFWDGLLCSFDEILENVPSDQVARLRRHLIVALGAPAQDIDFSYINKGAETLIWKDDHTEIEYILGATQAFGSAKPGNSQSVTVLCWDRQLQALAEAAENAKRQ
jgi:hypothetical protein